MFRHTPSPIRPLPHTISQNHRQSHIQMSSSSGHSGHAGAQGGNQGGNRAGNANVAPAGALNNAAPQSQDNTMQIYQRFLRDQGNNSIAGRVVARSAQKDMKKEEASQPRQ